MGEIIGFGSARARSSSRLEPLWREVLGRRLRQLRLAGGEKLVDTATRAGVSPQYLSEVERGLKDPSSEMIAAMAGALGTDLVDLTAHVTRELSERGTTADRGSAFLLAA